MWKPGRNAKGRSEVGEYGDALPPGVWPGAKGRAAGLNPGNRFETVRLHVLGDYLDAQRQAAGGEGEIAGEDCGTTSGVVTQVLHDRTRTIINEVESKDIGIDWTVNPYRGCAHGCIYCYARPYHEYLGFSCGLDFETRIMVKPEAPRLLERELAQPTWKGEPVVMSGISDCWQPLERELRLARRCLEVLAKYGQPVTLITRSSLIVRDLDLIQELHRQRAVHVLVSLTTLRPKLAARMEPRASSPGRRLWAMAQLSAAGIPVQVMAAPIIPGLTDREIPAILKAAHEAGARHASYTLVRLPYQMKELFADWLRREMPDRAEHVLSLLRGTQEGKLYNCAPGRRMRGTGHFARQIEDLFKVYQQRYKLDRGLPPFAPDSFRRPALDGQLELFAPSPAAPPRKEPTLFPPEEHGG